MDLWWILFAIFALAVADDGDDDHGEYGQFNMWRKTLCERGSEELFQEMDVCMEKEPEITRKTWIDCFTKSSPESEGKTIPYMNEACKDKSIFFKMDECLKEHEFVFDEIDLTDEAVIAAQACYQEVITKNEMPELLFYFEDDYHKQK